MRRCTTVNAAVPMGPDFMKPWSLKGAAAAGSHQPRTLDANGNRAAGIVMSRKTGARARVGVAYAARFQAYIDDLETQSRRARAVHGRRSARPLLTFQRASMWKGSGCVPTAVEAWSTRRCNLPGRVTLGQIAAAHGLFEGGRWCNSDYGHAQVDVTAAACGRAPHTDRAEPQSFSDHIDETIWLIPRCKMAQLFCGAGHVDGCTYRRGTQRANLQP